MTTGRSGGKALAAVRRALAPGPRDRTTAGPPPARAYVEHRVNPALRWGLSVMASAGEWASDALDALRKRGSGGPPPAVEVGGPPVVIRGTAFPGDEKTYLHVPFEVRPGVTRVEVDYEYGPLPPALPDNPITQTVVDLGLWDEHGVRDPAGFRGWSGSRQPHVFVQADSAQRAYRPGPVNPGIWYAELGLAAIGPTGGEWKVTVRGTGGPVGEPPVPDPVDPTHVANAQPGWYHGDFHMHSWHSNPKGPTPEEFVAYGRKAGLDFLPVTEYVVGHHWTTYGAVQRANPDLVIWPGREIVTYFGHVQSIGETPGFVEYRHGFDDVHIRDIQTAVREGGALFGVNHPTTFPGPLFQNFCRGCAFELEDEIDWDAVDTIEVLTGPVLVRPKELQMSDVGVDIPNPFMRTAVDLWESLLNRGHRICAVSGSDDKKGPGLGSSATAVFARELSRPALIEAVRAGRAYVRTRGVDHSPALELVATAPGGQEGGIGSTLVLDGLVLDGLVLDGLVLDGRGPGPSPGPAGPFGAPGQVATVEVTVTGGAGHSLRVVRNGDDLYSVPVDSDPFTHRFEARRVSGEGPLGTWYRVETFDSRSRTTISNPVFFTGG